MTRDSISNHLQESITLEWFIGGRVERHVKGTTYSHTGDIRIISLKGRTPWTRRLMIAMANVQMLDNGHRHDCRGPDRPVVIRLKYCDIDILDGNCAVLTEQGSPYRYTLYPFTQNWQQLEARLIEQ